MKYIVFILVPFLSFGQVKLKGFELTDSTQTSVKLKDDNSTKIIKGFVLSGGLVDNTPVDPPTGPTCSDGIQNGDETGVDCGGSCPPCVIIAVCDGGGSGSLAPTTAADFENASYIGYTFTINTSINLTGVSFVSGLKLIPGTGVLSGTNINLNDACIEDTYTQIFAPSVSFTTPYDSSRLTVEAFGGDGTDLVADDSAIAALINNSVFARGGDNRVYIKNQETTFTRPGIFDWDLLQAVIRTTNANQLSHGPETSNDGQYLFMFDGVDNIRMYNGEADGQDLASRFMSLKKMENFYFSNLYVHNYYSPPGAYARGKGFDIRPNPITYGFTRGDFENVVVESIGAASDGNANNSPYGVSKAFNFNFEGNGTGDIYFENVTVDNIYGDDAEGMYTRPALGTNYDYVTNNVTIHINNSLFKACQRRGLKINASNVNITNSTFESPSNAPIFNGAQATIVSFFSIYSSNEIQNIVFTGNTVVKVGSSKNLFFGMNDIENSTFTNNTFTAPNLDSSNTFSFGVGDTEGGRYSGFIGSTVTFSNNTITNGIFLKRDLYESDGSGFVVSDITMNLNDIGVDNWGSYWAAIRINEISNPPSGDPITFRDMVINAEVNGTNGLGLFGGVLNTQGQEPKNMTFDNVDINYTGTTSPIYKWAYTGKNDTSSDFDSTNTIIDCNITGEIGTGAVFVKGSDKSVVIIRSFGDGTTPITVQ